MTSGILLPKLNKQNNLNSFLEKQGDAKKGYLMSFSKQTTVAQIDFLR